MMTRSNSARLTTTLQPQLKNAVRVFDHATANRTASGNNMDKWLHGGMGGDLACEHDRKNRFAETKNDMKLKVGCVAEFVG